MAPTTRQTAITMSLLAGSAFLAILLLLAGLFRVRDQAITDNFNSDRMYCFAIGQDVLGSGYPLTNWHLTGVPYLFPDVTLLLPCMLLSSDLTIGFLIYSLLFYPAMVLALLWLVRQTGVRPLEAWLLACSGMVLVAVAGLSGPSGDAGLIWFFPGFHSGAILVGLYLVALVLRSLGRGWGPVSAGVFVLLGGIGAFSDRLLVVQFLAPMALALLLLTLGGVVDYKRLAVHLGLVAGAILLALAIKEWFQSLGFVMLDVENDFDFGQAGVCLATFLHHLPESIWARPVFLVAVPLFLLTGSAVIAGWARSVAGQRDPATESRDNSGSATASATANCRQSSLPGWQRRAVLAVALIGLLSPLCNLAAVLLTGRYHDQHSDRYLLSLVYLPCLFPGLFLRLAPWKGTRLAGLALPVVIAAFAVCQLWPQASGFQWADLQQPYPELVRAVDQLARERGFKRGLAGFWSAKHVAFLSREHVSIKAICGDGRPYLHAENSASFLSPDPRDLTVPQYHFIIVGWEDTADPDQIAQHYGEPDETKIVGDHEIWIYHRMRNPDLDRFLRGLLAVKYRRQCRFITPLSPAQLARPKANFSDSDGEDSVQLELGQELEARFAGPVSGRLLDIAAHSSAGYAMTFYRAEAAVGKLVIPPVPWAEGSYNGPCLFSRLLPVPDNLRGRQWDRVIVRPVSGPGPFSVGHLLVFE